MLNYFCASQSDVQFHYQYKLISVDPYQLASDVLDQQLSKEGVEFSYGQIQFDSNEMKII